MEAQSKECIFVGYIEGLNGYSLLYTTSDTYSFKGVLSLKRVLHRYL